MFHPTNLRSCTAPRQCNMLNPGRLGVGVGGDVGVGVGDVGVGGGARADNEFCSVFFRWCWC